MSQQNGLTFRPGEGELISMRGGDVTVRPRLTMMNGKMTEVSRESAIVISTNCDDLGVSGQLEQSGFDPLSFRSARARRMNEIAEKEETRRRKLIADGSEFCECTRIRNWPQLTPAALGPAVAEVRVRNDGGALGGYPQHTGGVRAEAFCDRDQLLRSGNRSLLPSCLRRSGCESPPLLRQ